MWMSTGAPVHLHSQEVQVRSLCKILPSWLVDLMFDSHWWQAPQSCHRKVVNGAHKNPPFLPAVVVCLACRSPGSMRTGRPGVSPTRAVGRNKRCKVSSCKDRGGCDPPHSENFNYSM